MTPGHGPELPDDPYAPPREQSWPRRPSFPTGIVPFRSGAIFAATWDVFRHQFASCIAVGWTTIGLLILAQYLQNQISEEMTLDPNDRASYFLVQFGAFFAGYVVTTWLTVGQNMAFLEIARGGTSVLQRVFQGFPFLLTTLLAGLVFALAAVLIPSLLYTTVVRVFARSVGAGGGLIALEAIAGLVAVGVGLCVGARLCVYNLVIVDQSAGVMESLRRSWETTRGRAATMVLILLMLFLVNLAGLLACLAGLLFTVPYSTLLLTVAYLSLTEQPLGADLAGFEDRTGLPD